MPTITYVDHQGNAKEVHAAAGTTVMQAAVDNGIDEIQAECGGACSCATCHCYVDDNWASKFDEAGEIEQEMLTCVTDQQPNSRLSCQLEVTDEHDGLVVSMPESQY